MTISDCIAQLTRLMKTVGTGAEVRVCKEYNNTEQTFDAFEIRNPIGTNTVYLVPSDCWLKTGLNYLAQREASR